MLSDMWLSSSEWACEESSWSPCANDFLCQMSGMMVAGVVSVKSFALNLIIDPLLEGFGNSGECVVGSISCSSIGWGPD